MAERSIYKCPLCVFESCSRRLQLSHLRTVHSNDPRFNVQCGLGGCGYTATSFSALYSHIYRHHKDEGIITRSDQQASNSSLNVAESEVGLEVPSVDVSTDLDLSTNTLDGKS